MLVIIYTGLFFGAEAMLVRFGFSVVLLVSYVAVERSLLSASVTAFLSPALLIAVFIVGAVCFRGDFLLFIYNCGGAMISLTCLQPKSLAAYIAVSGAALAVLLFLLQINLLGRVFSDIYLSPRTKAAPPQKRAGLPLWQIGNIYSTISHSTNL